jgi:hypothetical protein
MVHAQMLEQAEKQLAQAGLLWAAAHLLCVCPAVDEGHHHTICT